MIEIPLSKRGKYKGKYVALVDDCDSDLADFNWTTWIDVCNYACRILTCGGARTKVSMHRVILERMIAPDVLQKGEMVDHVDGNGLNNQRSNLRRATPLQNAQNAKIRKDSTSGYKGVSHYGKRYYVGRFDTALEAWEARCKKTEELHQDFANNG